MPGRDARARALRWEAAGKDAIRCAPEPASVSVVGIHMRDRAVLNFGQAFETAERCREIDEGMGLPVIRAALQDLADDGELVNQPIEMATRILFAALCEAAMAAGADPNPRRARDEAASVLDAIIAGLRAQKTR